jgi:hypothetical protein
MVSSASKSVTPAPGYRVASPQQHPRPNSILPVTLGGSLRRSVREDRDSPPKAADLGRAFGPSAFPRRARAVSTPRYGTGVMINRDSWGRSYFVVRVEILGFTKDELVRKHSARMFSLIKN